MGPLDACNIWLILGERSALLIDAGIGVSPLRPVVEAITDLPVALLLTHSHFDHIGGAHEFADRRMHRAEAEVLADPTPERLYPGHFRDLDADDLPRVCAAAEALARG